MTSMIAHTRLDGLGEKVELFQLDLTRQGGIVHYFTNCVFEERIPIKFGGNTYLQLAVKMDELEVDAQSSPDNPSLSIATAGGPVSGLMAAYKDLKRARVTRLVTFSDYLDVLPIDGVETPNPNADPLAVIQSDLFVIDRKLGADHTFAEFSMTSPIDQEGVQLPLRVVKKRSCGTIYRFYDQATGTFIYTPQEDGGCPYDGVNYFDKNDNPTTAANDDCSWQVSGCTARFGKTVTLPFGGFVGVRAQQES